MRKANAKTDERRLTKLEFAEMAACHPDRGAEGFIRFCANHVKITDKEGGREFPFVLWDCQVELAYDLVSGQWLIVLKARQLGITWEVAAFSLWKMTYCRFFTTVVINQKLPYAVNFATLKFKFMHVRLPDFLRLPVLEDTKTSMRLGSAGADGWQSNLFCFAGNEDAGRSETANLLIYDEASRIEDFEECHNAAEPTLKNVNGQSVVISTSRGPVGKYYAIWRAADRRANDYKNIFFPWHAHPARDAAWYEKEQNAHREDAHYMKREFPGTPEEAFEASGGRVFPWFRRATHALSIPSFEPRWKRYRGIDWGESRSAFVCVWAVAIPSDSPKLTYDPGLTDFEEPMLAYSYKEGTDEPEHDQSHAPDALRYLVCTYDIEAHLHVYRILVIHDPVGKGHTAQTLIRKIKEMSGWGYDEATNVWKRLPWWEQYEGTVYDRSRPMLDNEFSAMGESAEPHFYNTTENLTRKEEVRAGHIMVNKLVVGALPAHAKEGLTPEQEKKRFEAQPNIFAQAGLRSTVPIVQIIRRNAERRKIRDALKRRRRPYVGIV